MDKVSIAQQFVLAPDVEFAPPPREFEDQAVIAMYRPGARTTAKLIDIPTQELLERFRVPSTIVEAVVQQALVNSASPDELLTLVWPAIHELIRTRYLLNVNDQQSKAQPVFAHGERFQQYTIVDCVRIMEDTQVYRAIDCNGAYVAIKTTSGTDGQAGDSGRLSNERDILAKLQGIVGPRLLASGIEPFCYIVIEWVSGQPLAAWIRRAPREVAIRLAIQLAEAYARLHEAGILHGDINPNNVIVLNENVYLIDFGAAFDITDTRRRPRFGIFGYQEPEVAEAELHGKPLPPASVLGEQFSVAAIAYQLITSTPWTALPSERTAAIKQIVEAVPEKFHVLGVFGEPTIESVIRRALSKNPEDRFPSMRIFADTLKASSQGRSQAGALIRSFLTVAGFSGQWMSDGLPLQPRVSLNFGAAGIALALYELSIRHEDPSLLQIASEWIARAVQDLNTPDAFLDEEGLIVKHLRGSVSVWHGPAGVFWVAALIADALGDLPDRNKWLARFAEHAAHKANNMDLTLGRTGMLACAATLYSRTRRSEERSSGEMILQDIWHNVSSSGPIGPDNNSGLNLGMAHGWAGLIWSSAQWSIATQTPIIEAARERALELATHAVVAADGALRWPWYNGGRAVFAPGWCNGTVGFVMMFCAMASACDAEREQWLDYARKAALAIRSITWNTGHLCCGASACVFAMAELYRLTQEDEWLDLAKVARNQAILLASQGHHPASLYRGELGPALVDVSDMSLARLTFPGFGSNGSPV